MFGLTQVVPGITLHRGLRYDNPLLRSRIPIYGVKPSDEVVASEAPAPACSDHNPGDKTSPTSEMVLTWRTGRVEQ